MRTFDAGPKTPQLPVHPTGAHHLIDLQPAFLGEGDVLDAVLFGPLQIVAAGEAPIAADLSRPASVEVELALSARAGTSRHRQGSPAPQEPVNLYYPGDDLFTPFQRRRGLPIGNLTSQFFANLYLNGLGHFCKEVLRAKGYLRYVDDFALFHDDRERQPRTGDSSGFLHGDGGGGCSRMVESKADPMNQGSDTLTPGDSPIRGNGEDPANYGERIATLETKFNWILGSIGAIVLAVSSFLWAHWETICKILDGLKSLSSMTPPST